MWPQFGDDVLEETLSISEGARQSLNKKKEAMSDWHKENLIHHGLAPKPENVPTPAGRPPPDAPQHREEHEWPDELYDYVRGRDDPASQPARPPQEPGGPQEELPFHLHETEPDAPAPPSIQRGASGFATPGAIHYGNDDVPETRPDYPMSEPRRSIQVPAMGALPSQAAPFRAREAFRIAPDREIGLATQATPAYAAAMPVDDIADADIANRVPKREREVKLERKVKVKTEPVKAEVKIKQEGASHRGPGSTQPPPLVPDDEDLQTVAVNFNNNEDMSYWEQASGNEMKAQLNLRFPQLSGNWQYKSRAQLISTIRGLIRKNQWVQGGSQGPVRASAAAERSTPYQRSAAVEDDDDVEVSGVTWDQNTDPEYWKEQSAAHIRKQLAAKFPNKRIEFSFFTERQQYIDYILNMIKKKQYP
jgi:hypothetical protein